MLDSLFELHVAESDFGDLLSIAELGDDALELQHRYEILNIVYWKYPRILAELAEFCEANASFLGQIMKTEDFLEVRPVIFEQHVWIRKPFNFDIFIRVHFFLFLEILKKYK